MVGLVLFYRALSQGAMTVVAPVTAVTSAAIPVVVGLAAGERPPLHQLVGVGCALLAIALVSLAPPPPGERIVVTPALVGLAVASGSGFAMFFVFMARAGQRCRHRSPGSGRSPSPSCLPLPSAVCC